MTSGRQGRQKGNGWGFDICAIMGIWDLGGGKIWVFFERCGILSKKRGFWGVRLDTWFLGKRVTFGVKLLIGKGLSGENAISRFLHFLRFFARFMIKSG